MSTVFRHDPPCVTLVFFPEKVDSDDPPWVVPLVVRRVHSDEKATSMWVEQIKVLMENETLPFHEDLCVHVEDSVYSAVTALGPPPRVLAVE